MSKYAALQYLLESAPASQVPMTFAEIERVIGAPLPASSRNPHYSWWGNDQSHVQCRSGWMAGGYLADKVDFSGETVVFRRA